MDRLDGSGDYPAGPDSGLIASLTAPGGAGLSYSYDGFLPTAATWTGPVAGSVGLTYDTDFRVSTLAVNGANAITYGYDGDGLLTQAGALGIKRDAVTGLLARDSVGSATGAWSFDNRGALSGYAATVAGSTLFQTGYTRDSLSRITQLVETVQGTTTTWGYEYDDAGRLWQVTRNGTLTSVYGYDLNGNRLSVTGPGRNETGTYDDQDRLLGYNGTTYSYTRAGELQTKIDVSGTTQYQYDFLGNLTRVTLPDATVIEYVIDGQNRRIGKKVNGVLTQGWLYQDQLEPVAELDGAGAVVTRFVYGTRSTVPDYLIKNGTTYRVIADHLGSVRLVVDASTGAVAQRLDYDEYGRVTLNTTPGFQPFGYAGGLFDNQTGLVRFGARDYDPSIGRWTVRDPIGFAGGNSNLFEYADDAPLNGVDPWGTQRYNVIVTSDIWAAPAALYPYVFAVVDSEGDPVAAFQGSIHPDQSRDKCMMQGGCPEVLPGTYPFQVDMFPHNQRTDANGDLVPRYPALDLRETPSTAARNLLGVWTHRGSPTTTGSEGCLTVQPERWEEFMSYFPMGAKGTVTVRP